MSERSPCAAAPASPKAARATLVRLSVATDICPHVTLRVLNLVAQHGLVAATIMQTTRARSYALELVFARPADARGAMLLARVEAVVGVRQARLDDLE
jgi:acetolactate synthase regulatory subunit